MNYCGVAISGRAGCGKSTLAATLQAEYLPRGTVTPFARFLKEEVKELYGVVKGDPGSREAFLEHGAKRRAEDPDYWVKATGEWIDGLLAIRAFPIVDDLRYPNEYEFCRQRGFLLVRLHAPLEVRKGRLKSQGLDPNFALSRNPSEILLEQHAFHLRLQHGGNAERLAAREAVSSRIGLARRVPLLRQPVRRLPDAAVS